MLSLGLGDRTIAPVRTIRMIRSIHSNPYPRRLPRLG
jgi:hypothetical protein